MITNTFYRPSYLQGAYNPIIWSVLSDATTNTDFKYVFDVYKDGVFIIRLKQRPNPQAVGMTDVSAIAQGYLQVNQPQAPVLQGETTIDWPNYEVYSTNGSLSAHFTVRVGEEFTFNGVTQIYNGVTNVPGQPAFTLYSANAQTATVPIHVWPSSVDFRRQQFAMSNDTTLAGAYGEDPVTGRVYDHGLATQQLGDLAYPLSCAPLSQSVYAFDKGVLSYINWSANVADANNRPIYGFKFAVINGTTSVTELTFDIPMTTVYGYAQRSSCEEQLAAQLAPEFDIVHVLMSPDDIVYVLNDLLSEAYVLQPGDRIEIQGYNLGNESPCGFGDPVTELSVFTILEYCEPQLYPRVRLSWLNTLGGRDYLNFTALTEKVIDVTQESYYQSEMNWASLTPVQTNVTYPTNNLGVQGGEKIYNKSLKTAYKVQTDWLTQDYVNLVEGLVASPQVIAYIKEGEDAFADYMPYAVKVKQTNYVTKSVRQGKIVQVSFDIELTHVQKIQNA